MNLFDLFDDDGLSVYAETFADEKEEKMRVRALCSRRSCRQYEPRRKRRQLKKRPRKTQ